MKKIRKGDQVVVISGKHSRKAGVPARRGVVLAVVDDRRVIVEGVNVVKRHTKPNPYLNNPGGIVEKEAPIDVANVALFNPTTQKPDRVGFRTLEDGRKVRFYKSNGEVVDT
ncbi:MAG: 50S ribosomal protein L24 [Gammaproteobacteria bacterium]